MKSILQILLIFTISISILSCQSETNNNNTNKIQENNISNSKKEVEIKSTSKISKYVNVKYRNSQVDLYNNKFEYKSTSGSSFVNGTRYDKENKYLIIKLNGTYYHYCGLNNNTWSGFKSASSYGSYYNKRIKGNYNCRNGHIPLY